MLHVVSGLSYFRIENTNLVFTLYTLSTLVVWYILFCVHVQVNKINTIVNVQCWQLKSDPLGGAARR